MKKFISMTLILIGLGIVSYLLLFNSIIPINNLTAITIYDDHLSPTVMTMNEDKETLTTYAKIMNTGKKVATPTSFTPEYTLEVSYKNKASNHFELDFDLKTQLLTVKNTEKNRYYLINKDHNTLFFTSPIFNAIYPNSAPPKVSLIVDELTAEPYDSSLEWRYKLVNNEWQYSTDAVASLEETVHTIKDHSRSISLKYDIEPTSTFLQISDGEELLEEFPLTDGTFMPYLSEGTYLYKITSEWITETYSGTRTDQFLLNTNLPVQFSLSKSTATAGDFIIVYAKNVDSDEQLFIDQNLVSWTPSFFKNDSVHMAFIPLNYWAKTGNYNISLSTSKSENKDPSRLNVQIKNKNFKKQYLYIDETVEKSTRNDDAYAQYAKYFNPSRDIITDKQLWDGPFITPVEGRISTEFGEMRYVNDALTSYRHSGTDYAVPKGTPVKAPNNGRVNLSMFLTLTGNTVVIDHGLGLFSVYFHMDSLNVEKGQMVVKGDSIGTVGSTGFSTGPHLHYTTSIGKVNFDSLLLSDYDPSKH